MVSKVRSGLSGVLDLWGVLEKKKKKKIKERVNVWLGVVEWESGLVKE